MADVVVQIDTLLSKVVRRIESLLTTRLSTDVKQNIRDLYKTGVRLISLNNVLPQKQVDVTTVPDTIVTLAVQNKDGDIVIDDKGVITIGNKHKYRYSTADVSGQQMIQDSIIHLLALKIILMSPTGYGLNKTEIEYKFKQETEATLMFLRLPIVKIT